MTTGRPTEDAFVAFAREMEPKLRVALVGACGPERAVEATEEALVFAWEHWDRVNATDNPAGYLYRVAQRRASRWGLTPRRPSILGLDRAPVDMPMVEPRLDGALRNLSRRQRVAVLLTQGYGYSLRETGRLLGVSPSTVRAHVERGMAKLRNELGVVADA